MVNHTRRRAAAVAAVLTLDGLLHVYWSTGSTWPASDARSLSYAVLGIEAPFTPRVVLPLAALLFTAAVTVYARARIGRRRRLGHVVQAGTLLVAAGLLTRALAGVVWAFGVGVEVGSAFYWLNLLLYTPLCVAAGLAALATARDGAAARSRPRRVTLIARAVRTRRI